MLQTHPELREKVRLVQVAVPSRTNVGAYQDFRALVDGLVGRINGAFGTPRWVPVHYIFRALSEADLVALYRAADVMLVTPLRDGMNLVAKEFVASRTDGDGVLVLSEFAGRGVGAARGPPGESVRRGRRPRRCTIARSPCRREERRARLAPLRTRVHTFDVHRWVASFLEQLAELTPDGAARQPHGRRRRRPPCARPRAWRRPTRCSSCWTTTGRWCRSPRRPSWPARTRRSSTSCGRSPRGPTPRCTS